MGFLDLVSWVTGREASTEADERSRARAAELAADAPSETVTAAVLTSEGTGTRRPLVTYLDPNERPQYVLCGSALVVADADGSTTRKHPSRELRVVASDRRLLFVVGGRVADDLMEVPLGDVSVAYVDEEAARRHLVVEADREGVEMTFFADVTLHARPETVERCREYIGTS